MDTRTREGIQAEIHRWERFLAVWDRCEIQPGDDVQTAAVKLYIRQQSTQQLRHDLSAAGYKIPYDAKISDYITGADIADKELEAFGKQLFRRNKQHARRL